MMDRSGGVVVTNLHDRALSVVNNERGRWIYSGASTRSCAVVDGHRTAGGKSYSNKRPLTPTDSTIVAVT